MADALYSREMLRLATTLADFPLLGSPARAERRSPVCGSHIVVDVILDDAGRITKIGQKVRACAFGQASAALMAQSATGKRLGNLISVRADLSAFLAGDRADPGDWPGLQVFEGAQSLNARHAAILLPFDTLIEAAQEAGHA